MNPINLEGKRVMLFPMEKEHVEELYSASKDSRIWEYLPAKINGIKEMELHMDQALKSKKSGEQLPFVVYDKVKLPSVGVFFIPH